MGSQKQFFKMKSVIFATLAALLVASAFAAPKTKNIITCTICTDLITIADDAITDGQNVADIEAVLDGACDILVGIEQDCKDFVHQNLQMVIDLLVNQYLEPTQVCEQLALCP